MPKASRYGKHKKTAYQLIESIVPSDDIEHVTRGLVDNILWTIVIVSLHTSYRTVSQDSKVISITHYQHQSLGATESHAITEPPAHLNYHMHRIPHQLIQVAANNDVFDVTVWYLLHLTYFNWALLYEMCEIIGEKSQQTNKPSTMLVCKQYQQSIT